MAAAYLFFTTSPPPSYRSRANDGDQYTTAIEPWDSELLSRALLDILAFTYKIDLCDLTVALGWTKCLHPTRHGTSSLLTPEEHVRLLHISKVIEKSRKRLIRSRRSFLSQADITIINSIVAPARKLRLLPSYVCLLLELYCRHQMQPSKHRHTIRYFSKTRLWRWLGESEQRTLQERLVSDRHLVKQLLTHNENAASLYQKEIQNVQDTNMRTWFSLERNRYYRPEEYRVMIDQCKERCK